MFGLSGSKSKSRSSGFSSSDASSRSFGVSQSVQGAESGSVSGGASRSVSQGQSAQRIAFEDVFSRLFRNAESSAGALDPSLLTTASNQLFSSGTQFLEGIGGDAGSEFLTERLARSGALEEEQLGLLQEDIGRLFREELDPAITSEAIAGGQLGGGRQGVAQAGAAEAAADAFTEGAVDIRTRNQAQLDAIAEGIASRNLQGAQVGLAGGDSLAALAELGFGADFRSIQMLAEVFGGPTTLTDSSQQAASSASDFARAFSESFGRSSALDASRSDSRSRSRTQSTSSSKSAGIGF